MITKSGLAIELSRLKTFDNPRIKAEQYPTDPETAAEILWFAYMQGDIEGKAIADLGCGTGILGKGALLLGAKKIFFVDNDENAMKLCRENVGRTGKAEFLLKDVEDFRKKADTVIQNPPFGTKTRHADKSFLEKAFEIANVVYSIHKMETRGFINELASRNGFETTNILEFEMPLKATQKFHKRRIHRIRVGCWRFEKSK